ncbi:MAG TPA: hypothetical protein DDY13_13535 [Cytophagales bacterium]|jgi:DUF4097 and DUF4098 domain-containing protein YvlB|nr:hypothetical protein [Cytophagales bacterium]
MKRIIQLNTFPAIVFLTSLIACNSFAGDPYRTEVFNADNIKNVDVGTSGGSITVYGGELKNAKVEMYVKTNWGSKNRGSIKSKLDNYDIKIAMEGNTLIARAKKTGGGWNNGLNISFKVFVPSNVSSTLHTSGGSITMAGLKGRQELKTSGGSIKIKEVDGTTDAVTSGGSINIERYIGSIDARTSGGSISVNDGKGDFKLNTSGGSIRLDRLAGSIDATTSGGGISADLTEAEGAITLKTSGGGIRVNMPANLGLDLDLRGNNVDVQLSNFSGEAKRDRVKGRMNGGGIPVTLATSGGGVHLDFH